MVDWVPEENVKNPLDPAPSDIPERRNRAAGLYDYLYLYLSRKVKRIMQITVRYRAKIMMMGSRLMRMNGRYIPVIFLGNSYQIAALLHLYAIDICVVMLLE